MSSDVKIRCVSARPNAESSESDVSPTGPRSPSAARSAQSGRHGMGSRAGEGQTSDIVGVEALLQAGQYFLRHGEMASVCAGIIFKDDFLIRIYENGFESDGTDIQT